MHDLADGKSFQKVPGSPRLESSCSAPTCFAHSVLHLHAFRYKHILLNPSKYLDTVEYRFVHDHGSPTKSTIKRSRKNIATHLIKVKPEQVLYPVMLDVSFEYHVCT